MSSYICLKHSIPLLGKFKMYVHIYVCIVVSKYLWIWPDDGRKHLSLCHTYVSCVGRNYEEEQTTE